MSGMVKAPRGSAINDHGVGARSNVTRPSATQRHGALSMTLGLFKSMAMFEADTGARYSAWLKDNMLSCPASSS